jgi:hypothetical protein
MNQTIHFPFPAVKHTVILPTGSGLLFPQVLLLWSFLRVRALVLSTSALQGAWIIAIL